VFIGRKNNIANSAKSGTNNAVFGPHTAYAGALAPIRELITDRAGRLRSDWRTRHRHLALVVEGGALRAISSAAICQVLSRAGLATVFDSIHAVSMGAAIGVYFAANSCDRIISALLGPIREHVLRTPRALGLVPTRFDIQSITNKIAYQHAPLDMEYILRYHRQKPINIYAAEVERGKLEALPFENRRELVSAVSASCNLPLIQQRPLPHRDKRYYDGGVITPLPVSKAIEGQATDVLVVLSRPLATLHYPSKDLLAELGAARAINRFAPNLRAPLKRRLGVFPYVNTLLYAAENPSKNVARVNICAIAPTGDSVAETLETDIGRLLALAHNARQSAQRFVRALDLRAQYC